MINFMFSEFLPQNKNVELQEEEKKKRLFLPIQILEEISSILIHSCF